MFGSMGGDSSLFVAWFSSGLCVEGGIVLRTSLGWSSMERKKKGELWSSFRCCLSEVGSLIYQRSHFLRAKELDQSEISRTRCSSLFFRFTEQFDR